MSDPIRNILESQNAEKDEVRERIAKTLYTIVMSSLMTVAYSQIPTLLCMLKRGLEVSMIQTAICLPQIMGMNSTLLLTQLRY